MKHLTPIQKSEIRAELVGTIHREFSLATRYGCDTADIARIGFEMGLERCADCDKWVRLDELSITQTCEECTHE